MASSFGKIPTTFVRRLIAPLGRSMGFVELILSQCSRGKVMKARTSTPALVEKGGEPGQLGAQLVGD